MTERHSTLRELIELMELKEFKELLKKEEKKEEKKDDKKWWSTNPIKLYLILVLLYPFIGKAYLTLLTAIWK